MGKKMMESFYCIPQQLGEKISDTGQSIIEDSFTDDLNYFSVYRNFNYDKTYDAWIYDGNEKTETVGSKTLQSYPYKTPQFKEGDYIHFDYLKEGKLSTFLLLSLDTTRTAEVIGKMRPCTNELKFYDDQNILHKIPVVIDSKLTSSIDSQADIISMIQGKMNVFCQLNEESTLITKGMRFLFGRPNNWTAWSVAASGVNNYMNLYYDENTSARVLVLTLEASEIAASDDVINGVALRVNHIIPDDAEITVSPINRNILQGATTVFECGIEGVDDPVFSFEDITVAVPSDNYEFTIIDDKSFSIKNIKRYDGAPVIIRCKTDTQFVEIKLLLKGLF